MSDLYVDKFFNTRIISRFNTQTFKICLLYNFYIFLFMFLFMSLFTILFALLFISVIDYIIDRIVVYIIFC